MKWQAWSDTTRKRLKRLLRVPQYIASGIFEGLLTYCAAERQTGELTPDDIEALWDHLELDRDTDATLAALVKANVLVDAGGIYLVHGWLSHRPTFIRKRWERNSHERPDVNLWQSAGEMVPDFMEEWVDHGSTVPDGVEPWSDSGSPTADKTNGLSDNVRQMPDLGCQNDTPNLTQPNLTNNTPPPTKTSTHMAASDPGGGGGEDLDFSEVVQRLTALGVNRPDSVVAGTRLTPRLALDHIAHFERYPQAWGVGLLVWRLKNHTAETDGGEGWPAKSDEWREANRQQQKRRHEQAQAEDRRGTEAQKAADKAAREQLEAEHGAELDRLTEAQRLALLPDGSQHLVKTQTGRVAMLRKLEQRKVVA